MNLFSNQPLLLATHNKGKLVEISALLAPLGIKVMSASEAGVDEPEETGDSFIANAELKARYSTQCTGNIALSDDSGLVVPAIGGMPGIYSARWAGPNKDWLSAFERIRTGLVEATGSDQGAEAYFMCVLCLCMPDGRVFHFEGRLDGSLTFPPRGENGFGYDPIFVPAGYAVTFAEMHNDMKNTISHRARAFAKLVAFLKDPA